MSAPSRWLPHCSFAMLLLAGGVSSTTARAANDAPPASDSPERASWKFSAEGDVARLFLGSLSAHFMARPPGLPRLRFGIGRVGGALPKVFHTLFDPNEGWVVSEQGAAAQAFFHFSEHSSTAFVGGYVRVNHWEWRRPELPGSASGNQLFVMPAVGYRWFPSSMGVFIAPWAGLGVSVWDDGPAKLGQHEYRPLLLFPIAAIHVGYEG